MKHLTSIIVTFIILTGVNLADGQTIINSYAAVVSFAGCNQINVDNASGFSIGDDVLLIQMKGAEIDTTNTSAFGTLVTLNNCGNYEINKIQSITGNAITLTYNNIKSYDVPWGKVQLVKVPRYTNYAVNSLHSCTPWNGTKGGVFAIIVNNTLTLNADIDVSEKGFRGGVNANPIYHTQYTRNQQDYCFPVNNYSGAMKGEGITEVSVNRLYCRGELYTGGGGANSTNSGGGGGGNGGAGGLGGNEWVGAPSTAVGGRGGRAFNYNPANNRVTMGGGGGAGDVNDAYIANGGNGGGIMIIIAGSITGNSNYLLANGQQGLDCISTGGGCNDGFGGGGAGGTILINAQSVSQLNIETKGGRGANVKTSAGGHGPGGGAAGGAVLVNNASLFSNIAFNYTGGAGGTFTAGTSTTNWGTQPGSNGDTTSGFVVPFATIPANSGNMNLNIKDTLSACQTLTLSATANTPLSTINWDFGDGNTGTGNPVTHSFSQPGTYKIVVKVNSSNGCYDTVFKNIIVPGEQMDELISDSLFNCRTIQLTSTSAGGPVTQYSWLTGDGNNGNTNPLMHTYSQDGNYTITLITTDALGCKDTFSRSIAIFSSLDYDIADSLIDCTTIYADTVNNGTTITTGIKWLWGDGNTGTAAPTTYSYSHTGTYTVQLIVTDTIGCTDTISTTVSPENIPIEVMVSNDTVICYASTIQLRATGADSYEWFPKNGLDNDKSAIVNVKPVEPITYHVTGIDSRGCKGSDDVHIDILPLPEITITSDKDR
ncbi:MAG: PKD domain-containing protein, partial [Chitinophagaceae bacterium]|nr:PKD domain-containing protein [Chitinophagaceae bacterium]